MRDRGGEIVLVLTACLIVKASVAIAQARRLPVEVYREKMEAGWLGQMIGVEWGLPTEFRYQGTTIPDNKVPVWNPEAINHSYDNDDLFVEMTFLRTLEKHGIDVTAHQAGLDFANTKYGLCAANWAGRDNLRRGIAPPDCGHPKFNACADCIDYQIESDYAGLISPGMPQRVVELSEVFGRLVNQGDGVWAGAFMGGLYSEAFFTNDINALLDAGLACIPGESQYAGMVRDVRRWYTETPENWRACWQKVKARYIDDPAYHRGRIDQPGSDVKPNGAFVVMGLLYGQGDLERTIRVAMQCGWDSDCNPSSAAGVLLTAKGLKSIDKKYTSGLDRTRKFIYSEYDFDSMLAVCEKMMRQNLVKTGGKIERDAAGREILVIPMVKPIPALFLPNWNPPPVTGKRYHASEMRTVAEKPFPGIGAIIKSRERQPLPPIGEGEKWMLGDHKEEYGMAMIPFCFAPYNLENEKLPIRISGLTNTVVHLGWGKCHTTKYQTIFAIEDCENVVLREAFVFFHAKPEENPPPLYTVVNSVNVKVYNVHVSNVGPDVAEMLPIRVRNGKVLAGDKPIMLRGINWGWWHENGTRYTENDMRRQSEWGANMLRLAVSYKELEDPARPGALREDGLRDIEEVLSWAEKFRQYVVLDMHVCPGGQNGFGYIDGGRKGIWTDKTCQHRYLSLWRSLAEHFRDRPVLAAYEVMNEPDTQRPTPEVLTRLQRKVIAAIRKSDPLKVVVVSGDNYSNARSLTAANVLDDDNLIYTFHFYECGGIVGGWVRNEAEDVGESGTFGWKRFDRELNITARDAEIAVLLRSMDNVGSAWFDDIEIVDETGKIVAAYSFDAGQEGFAPERGAEAVLKHDSVVGHSRSGSLRVSGTQSYNGWVGPRIKLPGHSASYRLRGWMRLEKATGGSYAAAAVFGTAISTQEKLEKAIEPVVAFQRCHNVPVFVGEFAVERGSDGHQPTDTAWRIGLFEKYGFSWAYWNYRETTSPETMALQAQRKDGSDFPINEPLLSVLKAGWGKNRE